MQKLTVKLPGEDNFEIYSYKIIHIRQRDKNGGIPTKGGSTVVVMQQQYDKTRKSISVYTGTAYCHINDTYDKKKGVITAIYKVLNKLYPDLVLSSVWTNPDGLLINLTNERFWLDANL